MTTVLLVGINYGLSIVGRPPAIPYADPYTFTFKSFGVLDPALFFQSGTLPDGISFTDNGDGTATLAGSSTQPGSFPIRIELVDSQRLPVFRDYVLRVALQPISVDNPNDTYSPGGGFNPYQVHGGIGPYHFSQVGGDLPPGVTLNDDGTFSGSVDPGASGHYCWSVTVHDDSGAVSDVTFTHCADLGGGGGSQVWVDITASTGDFYQCSGAVCGIKIPPIAGGVGALYTWDGAQWDGGLVDETTHFGNSARGVAPMLVLNTPAGEADVGDGTQIRVTYVFAGSYTATKDVLDDGANAGVLIVLGADLPGFSGYQTPLPIGSTVSAGVPYTFVYDITGCAFAPSDPWDPADNLQYANFRAYASTDSGSYGPFSAEFASITKIEVYKTP